MAVSVWVSPNALIEHFLLPDSELFDTMQPAASHGEVHKTFRHRIYTTLTALIRKYVLSIKIRYSCCTPDTSLFDNGRGSNGFNRLQKGGGSQFEWFFCMYVARSLCTTGDRFDVFYGVYITMFIPQLLLTNPWTSNIHQETPYSLVTQS